MGRLVLLALAMTACRAEKFVPPDTPDLYKVPYDFAPGDDLVGRDLVSRDLAGVDLAHVEDHPDLHVPDVDLAILDDLAHEEHD